MNDIEMRDLLEHLDENVRTDIRELLEDFILLKLKKIYFSKKNEPTVQSQMI